MSLDAALRRFRGESVPPVPPVIFPGGTPETPCLLTVPPVPPVPLENDQTETLRENRRQKVIAMLEAAPDTQRAIYADTDSDPDNVILAVAIRDKATCELLIPKAKYDPWLLLELIKRHGAQSTH